MDYGAEYTERQRRILYRRLRRQYREAQKNLEKKLKDFLAGSAAREKLYEKKVEAGLLTQSWFDNWKQGQVFIGKRWDAKLDEVTGTLTEANQKALAMIRGEQYKVFAENSNYQSYMLEKDGQKHNAGISFDIYDETTVRLLIQEKPELLKRSTWKSRKDKAWNQGIISNSIAQGIIQGESIPKIAERIARDTCDRNNTHMMLYARTAMTCAQNSGRIETMHRATDMGLHVKKEWIATLDSRTRDSHQHLDGQTAEVDEPFSSILGDIMFPGDPDAEPANVWNCRCTLGSVYVDYESDGNGKRRDQETGEEIEDMTYDEWKDWKEENRPEFQKVPRPPKEEEPEKREEPEVKEEKKEPEFEIPEEVRKAVTSESASEDWFEYEKANLMREYIETGIMPEKDMYQRKLSDEERQRLAAEAELIQKIGEKTKTKYKTLYRGMVMEPEDAREVFKLGKMYEFNTLSAATPDKKIAGIYTDVENAGGFGVPVMLEIQKSDGIYGFVRDDLETVLPKGSEFRVERFWTDPDGTIHISLYSKKGKNVKKE